MEPQSADWRQAPWEADDSTVASSINATEGRLSNEQKQRYACKRKLKRQATAEYRHKLIAKEQRVHKGVQKPGKPPSATRYCKKCGWLGSKGKWKGHWATKHPEP